MLSVLRRLLDSNVTFPDCSSSTINGLLINTHISQISAIWQVQKTDSHYVSQFITTFVVKGRASKLKIQMCEELYIQRSLNVDLCNQLYILPYVAVCSNHTMINCRKPTADHTTILSTHHRVSTDKRIPRTHDIFLRGCVGPLVYLLPKLLKLVGLPTF